MILFEGLHWVLMTTTACLVFLRAFQTQNVIHRHYYWAMMTSCLMAFAEVAVVLGVVDAGWSSVLWVGTGGAIGVSLSMFAHKRLVQCQERWYFFYSKGAIS